MTAPDRAYVTEKVAQIKMACASIGGHGVTAIIDQVRADGYPELAIQLAKEIIGAWRERSR